MNDTHIRVNSVTFDTASTRIVQMRETVKSRSFALRLVTAFWVVTMFAAARAVSAQGAPTVPAPSIPAAMNHFYRGDAAGAAKILEGVTAATPGNANAWRLLALCYRKTGELDLSKAAYRKAIALEPNSPAAMFNLAGVYAIEGSKDSAFALLAKAKASKNYDMTELDADSTYASLRSDPRYQPLLPTSKDFAEPFVEHVKVIREFDGDSAGDQFGWIARSMGDVDRDGITDFVTSAPTSGAGGLNAGRVYVYSSASGKLLWRADGKPGEQLGTGVESAGNVDGDGTQDVIAGAPYSGRAYVYSGKDGHVLFTLKAENDSDSFGVHVSTAGDVDRDGHADFIVGAPANNAGGAGAGRAYVYSGKDGHVLLTLTGEHAGDAFGTSVAGYADSVRSFIVIGAPSAGCREGRAHVRVSGADTEAEVHDRVRLHRPRTRRDVRLGCWRHQRRRRARHLRVGLLERSEGSVDGTHLRALRTRRKALAHAHGRRWRARDSASAPEMIGDVESRWPRGSRRRLVAVLRRRGVRADASICTPDATGTCSRPTPIASPATPSASMLSASATWMATVTWTYCSPLRGVESTAITRGASSSCRAG